MTDPNKASFEQVRDLQQSLASARTALAQARGALEGLLGVLAAYRKTGGISDGAALQGWEAVAKTALTALDRTAGGGEER